MFKFILFLAVLVLAATYAFGWFSDVGLHSKTTSEFNASFVYQWRSFFYQVWSDAYGHLAAFKHSVSKPS